MSKLNRKVLDKAILSWNQNSDLLLDNLISEFQTCGEETTDLSGSISMKQFISACQHLNVFNVLKLRHMASELTDKMEQPESEQPEIVHDMAD